MLNLFCFTEAVFLEFGDSPYFMAKTAKNRVLLDLKSNYLDYFSSTHVL